MHNLVDLSIQKGNQLTSLKNLDIIELCSREIKGTRRCIQRIILTCNYNHVKKEAIVKFMNRVRKLLHMSHNKTLTTMSILELFMLETLRKKSEQFSILGQQTLGFLIKIPSYKTKLRSSSHMMTELLLAARKLSKEQWLLLDLESLVDTFTLMILGLGNVMAMIRMVKYILKTKNSVMLSHRKLYLLDLTLRELLAWHTQLLQRKMWSLFLIRWWINHWWKVTCLHFI